RNGVRGPLRLASPGSQRGDVYRQRRKRQHGHERDGHNHQDAATFTPQTSASGIHTTTSDRLLLRLLRWGGGTLLQRIRRRTRRTLQKALTLPDSGRWRRPGLARRHLRGGVSGLNQLRRYDHEKLGPAVADTPRLEQVPDDRNVAQNRDFGKVSGGLVVHQPGDRQILPLAQLDLGLGATGAERGDLETLDGQAVREVERGYFRDDLEPDG